LTSLKLICKRSIDAEMVFTVLPEGQLQFKETAVQTPYGGESRIPDRQFAQIFSKNILKQGFAEAAKAQQQESQEKARNGQNRKPCRVRSS
jgi:hypothetical protein